MGRSRMYFEEHHEQIASAEITAIFGGLTNRFGIVRTIPVGTAAAPDIPAGIPLAKK